MADPTPVLTPQTTDPELTTVPTAAPTPNGTTATGADVEMVDSQPIKSEVRYPTFNARTLLLTFPANTATCTSDTRCCTYANAQFTTP
jgi:hypothetical protein